MANTMIANGGEKSKSFRASILTVCLRCFGRRGPQVRVLPDKYERKKTDCLGRSADDLLASEGKSPPREGKGIILALPSKNTPLNSEQSQAASRRSSIHSCPNRPLSDYVFPRRKPKFDSTFITVAEAN